MSDVDPIAAAAAELLSPLTVGLTGPGELASLLGSLGIDVELDADSASAVSDVLAIADPVADLEAAVARLESEPTAATIDVIAAAGRIWTALDGLASIDGGDLVGLPAPLDRASTWTELLSRLPGQLFATWLRDRIPVLQTALELVGVFTRDPAGASATSPAYRADWSALPALVGDPTGTAAGRLGWGSAFDASAAMGMLAQAAGELVTARWVAPPTEVVDLLYDGAPPAPDEARSLRLSFGVRSSADRGSRGELALVVTPVPGETPDSFEGLHLGLAGWGLTTELDLGSGWSLAAAGVPSAAGVLGARLTPDGVVLDPAADTAGLALVAAPPVPWRLLGPSDGTRIEVAGASFGLELVGGGEPEIVLTIGLTGLRVVLDPGALGGLFASVVPGGLEVAADVTIALSSSDGLRFNGLPGLTIPLVDRLALGPATLRDVVLEIAPDADGVRVEALTGVDFALGPFGATVEGAGLRTTFLAQGGTGGNLGPLDVHFAPTLPTVLGLGLDMGVVKAAGVLIYDPPADTYGGIISVEAVAVGISAVGIVTASSPDDWSVFFALFIEVSSIQLGFGFTLNGVGGLAGVNRTLDADALAAGVRSGSLDPVLFPANPVAEAPVIIDQLQAIFPPCDGRYVFGPVVKIGWGTPALIEAELGIVIALPDPIAIAILGTVTSVLPTKDVELVALHMDVGGVVDFAAGTLAIDASLHDSHVIGFALSGDMVLRATFGGMPSFLMSIGGFHPGFEPVEDIPDVARLSLGLSTPPILYVNFECYFAVTSNTVQFGSAFELRAQVAGFGIEGSTEFDALVQFSPFLVTTHLGFHVSVTAAGFDLAGVWLEANVLGPNPWYVVGTARFKILGIEEDIRVDERIGAPVPEAQVEEADPMQLVRSALSDEGAWSSVATASPGVVLAAGDPVEDELVAMPDGVVAVSQRAVPLGVSLDKVGDAPLGDYDLFHVEPAEGSLASTGTTQEWFAPGYFFEIAPSEQLSSPSFELLSSGIEFGSGEVLAGPARAATLDFEQILSDPELDEDRVELGVVGLTGDLLAATASVRRSTGFAVAPADEPISLAGRSWAVTHRNTGVVERTTATWSAAHQSPSGRRIATTVVPEWEVVGDSGWTLPPIDWEIDWEGLR